MNNLPDPREFKNFTMQLHKNIKFDTVLVDEDKKAKLQHIYKAINSNKNYSTDCIYNILTKEFLDSIDNDIKQKVYAKYLRYDSYEDSPCIIILNKDNDIETIAVHRAKDGTKWKKKTGSNSKYIANNIFDDVVFIAYGIAEMLILELLELPFILFQSDSITNTLDTNIQFQNEVLPLLKDKILVSLLDNDLSCIKTVVNINNSVKDTVQAYIAIEMIDILTTSVFFNDTNNSTSQETRQIWKNKEIVPNNYDFKDYVVGEFNPIKIRDIVFKTIENKLNGVL